MCQLVVVVVVVFAVVVVVFAVVVLVVAVFDADADAVADAVADVSSSGIFFHFKLPCVFTTTPLIAAEPIRGCCSM